MLSSADRISTSIGRFYKSDGYLYPSVTNILSIINIPELNDWRISLGKEQSEYLARRAAMFGTKFHNIIEDITTGRQPKIPASHEPHVREYLRWHMNNIQKVLLTEKQLVSQQYKYAGTLDMLAVSNASKNVLIDLKTSNHDSQLYALQAAAYRHMLLEAGYTVDEIYIVFVQRSDNKLRVQQIANNEEDFEAFLAAMQLWQWYYSEDIEEIEKRHECQILKLIT